MQGKAASYKNIIQDLKLEKSPFEVNIKNVKNTSKKIDLKQIESKDLPFEHIRKACELEVKVK